MIFFSSSIGACDSAQFTSSRAFAPPSLPARRYGFFAAACQRTRASAQFHRRPLHIFMPLSERQHAADIDAPNARARDARQSPRISHAMTSRAR